MGEILKLRKMPTLLRLRDAPQDPKIRVLRTTLNGAPEPHAHEARVDKNNNGITTIDAGHMHPIANGEIGEVYGHSHKLIEYKHTRSIAMRATGYHPGMEKSGSPNTRRPLAPPGTPGGGSNFGSLGPPGAGSGAPQSAAPGGPGFAGGEVRGGLFTSQFVHGPILSESTGAPSRFGILADVIQENDSVLDVGCGAGLLYEWLIRELGRPVSYFGLDHNRELLREFRDRFPEVGNRTASLEQVTPELFAESHFSVATCFGLPATMGQGPQKLARLAEVVGLMRGLADIIVVECQDKLYLPESEDGPSVWGVNEVRELMGDWKNIVVRPLVDKDFAIVAYRDGVL